MNNTETMIAVQTRQLEDWKKLLKPKVFKILKAEVTKDNHIELEKELNGLVFDPYRIIRGVGIDSILFNVVLKHYFNANN